MSGSDLPTNGRETVHLFCRDRTCYLERLPSADRHDPPSAGGERARTGVQVIIESTAALRQQAFQDRLRPHLRAIRAYARKLCANAHDAEDLVQDVLLKLYEKCDRLDGIDELRPWLLRVTYHRFVDSRRKGDARMLVQQELDFSGNGQPTDPLDLLPSAEPGPDTLVERSQLSQLLNEVIARLPPAQRQVLDLHHLRGLSLAEIAAHQRVSINTLKSSLLRARTSLRSSWLAAVAAGSAGAALDRAFAARNRGYGARRRRSTRARSAPRRLRTG
jgi:RNA polymerase sigma factor (sigma-70 family)